MSTSSESGGFNAGLGTANLASPAPPRPAAAAAPAAKPGAKKGFVLKSKVGALAPAAYKEAPPPPVAIKPAAVTTGFKATVGEGGPAPAASRGLFAAAAVAKPRAAAAAAAAKPKPVAPAAKPKPATAAAPAPPPPPPEEADGEELASLLAAMGEEEAAGAGAGAPPAPAPAAPEATFTGDLREMATLIQKEEKEDHYSTPVPDTYVPQTRRGFSGFIKSAYRTFELPEGDITIPPGEKYYPYQKFVRDYMRQESPYRGILVYHGLGSGKTCTSIATAEALYASAGKKIIVMANYSLKKNFFSEVSKCGFRHYQLKNYWVALDPKDATTTLFANQVLGLSANYIKRARNIWVPDFRKTPAEENYSTLGDAEREEIRAQILSVLEWHKEKNPTGRIRFIAYNGISAKKLMEMACDPAEEHFFDNSVIVVDEIHNLIRMIQGNIQPYMSDIATTGKRKSKRTIPIEIETPEKRWQPTVCDVNTKLYKRGYLFYRLFLDAKNTKIVGLSGTPLINFPEELGILANVLHGYIPICDGVIAQTGDSVRAAIADIAKLHPFIDFISVKGDVSKEARGTLVRFTLLPAGIRKIQHDEGVERIPPEEPSPSFEEIMANIKTTFADAKLPFAGEMKVTSEPLLPPFGEEFRAAFFGTDHTKETQELVLATRLTGLISYYKGSQLNLMPSISKDEVVRVPMGLYAQKAYTARRAPEVEQEQRQLGEGASAIDKVLSMIYNLADNKSTNNYKMGSRQACNFAFPAEVARPMPRSKKEGEAEAEEGYVQELTTAGEEEGGGAAGGTGDAGGAGVADEGLAFEGAGEGEDEAEQAEQDDEDAEAELEAALAALEAEEAGGAGGAGAGGDEEEGQGGGGSGEKKADPVEKTAKAVVGTILDVTVGEPGAKPKKRSASPPREGAGGADAAATPAPAPADGPIRFTPKTESEYKLFSNFAVTPFELGGKSYPSVEHYYQSQKYAGSDDAYAEQVRLAANPAKAKLMGRAKDKVTRANLETVKEQLVREAVEAKFRKYPALQELLLGTGERPIIEATATDAYWGEGPDGKGANKLGMILMQLREKLRGEKADAQRAVDAVARTEALLAGPPKPPKRAPAAIKPKGTGAGAVAAAAAAPTAAMLSDCKGGRKPGEDYVTACDRAKQCLATVAREHLILGGEDGLENYSPKYAAILTNIAAAPGSSLVYSQFLSMEGIGILRVAMDVNGYCPIEIVPVGGTYGFSKRTEESLRKGPGAQPRYITFSGGEEPRVRALALDLFNAKFAELTDSMNAVLTESGYKDNLAGEICRVFCITSAGAEGLSLRNVRAVHIMEPYWNEVRLRQVKGRAIRIGSHLDLPEDQRNVAIYTYLSVFSEQAQRSKAGEYRLDAALMPDAIPADIAVKQGLVIPAGLRTYTPTTDEMIFMVSERKRELIERLESVLKRAAIDCELNIKQNKEGESFKCLTLKGKVGDFVYNPVLSEDLNEARGRKMAGAEGEAAVPKAAPLAGLAGAAAAAAEAAPPPPPPPPLPTPAEPVLEPGEFMKKLNKVTYILKPILKEGTAEVERFRLLDVATREHVGYVGAKAGQPAAPLDLFKK